ncbi:MAG: diacylglycerol kinase family protein [Pseudomonadota bacterium]
MTWLQQRAQAFGHALQGVRWLLQETAHAKIHLIASAAVFLLAGWLQIARSDWQVLVLTVALVWLAEGMNSALEYLADAAVPEHHPLVGKAKDVAAGAVLTSASFAIVMAWLVFAPYVAA